MQIKNGLPIILLGLRTCYKEDLKASLAEYLHSTTLRVPGEFFTHKDLSKKTNLFLEDLRVYMRDLKPIPAAHYNCKKTFCFKDIHDRQYIHVLTFLFDRKTNVKRR